MECTSVSNAGTRREAARTDASDAARRSPNTSQAPGLHLQANSPIIKEQIRTAWCGRCGTFTKRTNGNCERCNNRLAEEYKAAQHTPEKIGLSASLIAEGYTQHFNAIDAEVARELPCKLCHSVCYYIGLKKGGSYRAISRCTGCGKEYEF